MQFSAITTSRSAMYPSGVSGPPVNRLPVELLIYIFEVSAIQSHFRDAPTAEDASLSQFPGIQGTCSQVCRLWRELTIHTLPSIWAFISVTGRITSGDIMWIQLYLLRSADRPLQISIVDVGLTPPSVNDAAQRVLLSSHRRWRSVRCRSLAFTYEPPLLSNLPIGAELPMLEMVIVECRGLSRNHWDQLFERLHHHSPRLRQLHVNGSPPTRHQWPLLTDISFRGSFNLNILDVFHRMSNLIAIDCNLEQSHFSLPRSPPTIQLPYLRSLKITAMRPADLSFLPFLAAPELESLALDFASLDKFVQYSWCIDDMLAVSQCSLTSYLFVTRSKFHGMEIACLARAGYQSLKTLHIIHDDLRPYALEDLFTSSTNPILPQLRSMTITCPGLTDGMFSRLVASRIPSMQGIPCDGPIPISSTAFLDPCQQMHSRDMALLPELLANGVSLDIRVWNRPAEPPLLRYACSGLPPLL